MTNKELEKIVNELREEVRENTEKITEIGEMIEGIKNMKTNQDAITTLSEVALELVEATKSINNRHSILRNIAEKLRPYLPKHSA